MSDSASWTEKVLSIFSLLSGSLHAEVNVIQLTKTISEAIAKLPDKATVSDEFFAIEKAISEEGPQIFIGKGWFAQLALTALYIVKMTHGG